MRASSFVDIVSVVICKKFSQNLISSYGLKSWYWSLNSRVLIRYIGLTIR